MPVRIEENLVSLTQKQFAEIAYIAVNEAFSIHTELGALFDEAVYRDAMVTRLENAISEVKIDVSFQDFSKSYYMDAVVAGGGIFEFKAVRTLDDSHRSQLLNYLLLSGTYHGKLINFGPGQVDHEFVNTTLTLADRRRFTVDDKEWAETDGFSETKKNLFIEIIADWGTGLSLSLYRDALFHFLGGEAQLMKDVAIFHRGEAIGKQSMPVCGALTTVHLTSFTKENLTYKKHISRLLESTGLTSAQWINITRDKITFKTLHSNKREAV